MKVIRRFMFLLCVGALMLLPGRAQPSASWEGLVGLFTEPTAETFQPGEWALTYSEARFGEEVDPQQSRDTWFSGSATITVSRQWEVALALRNELYETFQINTIQPVVRVREGKWVGDIKYIIQPPVEKKIGLAVGVQDIAGATHEIDGIDTGRGRRFFLVGSYQWAHLGLTDDQGGFGAFAGADWPVTNNINLIAEFSTRPRFAQLVSGTINHPNFNIGLRVIPCSVPRLRVDLAAVGDGKFDFAFSLSYHIGESPKPR